MGNLARLALAGLWSRRGVSLAVLVIASLVVGGAATGPLFLRAASESVLRDSLNEGLLPGRSVQDHVLDRISTDPMGEARTYSATRLADYPTLNRLLGPPLASVSVTAGVGVPGGPSVPLPLVYREGFCAHLQMVRGECAEQPGSVVVSVSTARIEDWRVGQALVANGRSVTVSGLYVPSDPTGDYWGVGHQYFAALSGSGTAGDSGTTLDAIFAPLTTLQGQGRAGADGAVDRYLDVSRIRSTDVPALTRELLSYLEFTDVVFNGNDNTGSGDIADSAIPTTLTQASSVMAKLTLPVVVVETQLLTLCWLILFLVVANAAEARGPEVALAKLRGWPPGPTVAFGLLDTLALVVFALPAGLSLAWVGVTALARWQLAPTTPVLMTSGTWLAAAGGEAGALVAAGLAASATLRRPVVEQWRRATRRVKARPWAVDVVVGLAAVAGLVVLIRVGGVDAGTPSAMALIAPGLIVLTAALVGSRVLPGLCRAAYGPTRRRGRVGALLAVRQLGRRPSTLRLALVLTVGFGLVTFGITAFAVARANAHDRAWTEVGAAKVLTVATSPGQDLGAVVDRLDPSGREAAAVSTATDYHGRSPVQLSAVQPDRFAQVAFWRPDFGAPTLRTLTDRLTVPTAPEITLSGDALQVRVEPRHRLAARAPTLVADVVQPNATGGPTAVTLGPVRPGAHLLRADLPCPGGGCRLAGFELQRAAGKFYPIRGDLTLSALRVHDPAGWTDVPGLATQDGWRAGGGGAAAATTGPAGLVLRADAGPFDAPVWLVADHPASLPALVPTSELADRGPRLAGLGNQELSFTPVSVGPTLPGSGGFQGVIVDRTYAQRTANGSTTHLVESVWLTPAAAATFPQKLEQAGVTILTSTSAIHETVVYQRQGPALAVLLFLVAAVLSALLAGGAAVLTLHLAGRRRTYELAAMSAVGVRRATLLGSLIVEQGLLVAFGVAVGVAAGLVGAWLALPAVPEFADNPTAPPLLYGVHLQPLVLSLAGAVVVLGASIILSSTSLIRGTHVEQLREAPA